MFQRAGGVPLKRKTDPLSEALTKFASVITVAPGMARSGPSSTNQASRNSPAKTIENRSRCYRQLGEIKNLYESGLLSETEYQSEREAIMSTLKILSCLN